MDIHMPDICHIICEKRSAYDFSSSEMNIMKVVTLYEYNWLNVWGWRILVFRIRQWYMAFQHYSNDYLKQ